MRTSADGPRGALLKLIAGSLGVGLRQRDQARRQKQLAIIAAAAMLGFAVMSGLTVMALISRREAVEQRDLACKRTATAERTVEFVQSLFEVSDPSEAQGAKITAKEVLDKGALRITGALANEPDVKAQLMTTLSQVYLGVGNVARGIMVGVEQWFLPLAGDPWHDWRYVAITAQPLPARPDRSAVSILDRDPSGFFPPLT